MTSDSKRRTQCTDPRTRRNRDPKGLDELLKPRAGATWQSLAWLQITKQHRQLLKDLDEGTWGFWRCRDGTLFASGPNGARLELDAAKWPVNALEADLS